MKIFNLNFRSSPKKPVIIVSGLPRSGTSMMMKILEAGGLEVLTDHQRIPDEDNPRGYYEFELVKQLKGANRNDAWLAQARGKVVKVISFLLQDLPAGYQYKIIFMRRDLAEILASQQQMLLHRGEKANGADAQMGETFQEHLKRVRVWLANQTNMQVLYVDYNMLVNDPSVPIKSVYDFLEMHLDEGKMLAVPDPSLYRQRKKK